MDIISFYLELRYFGIVIARLVDTSLVYYVLDPVPRKSLD